MFMESKFKIQDSKFKTQDWVYKDAGVACRAAARRRDMIHNFHFSSCFGAAKVALLCVSGHTLIVVFRRGTKIRAENKTNRPKSRREGTTQSPPAMTKCRPLWNLKAMIPSACRKPKHTFNKVSSLRESISFKIKTDSYYFIHNNSLSLHCNMNYADDDTDFEDTDYQSSDSTAQHADCSP
jgi:hypothetical protein